MEAADGHANRQLIHAPLRFCVFRDYENAVLRRDPQIPARRRTIEEKRSMKDTP